MVSGSRMRSLVRWHPRQELGELWRAMEQASNRFTRSTEPTAAVVAFIPEVDLYDAGTSVVIKVDLHGVPRENLDISTEDGTLTISGHRDPAGPEDAGCVSCERPVGRFARRIDLPKDVDIEHVTATLRNGVLEVVLPRAAKGAGRRVIVQEGAQELGGIRGAGSLR